MFEDAVSFGKNPHAFSGFHLMKLESGTFRLPRKSANLLVTFHGHRINIAVNYHKDDILDLINNLDKHNNLLKVILFDVKEKVYLAGARAMGIYYELVTAPFWKLLEDDGSIFDLNEDILQMKLTLRVRQWSEDGLEPLSETPMFSASLIQCNSEKFHDALFKDINDDEIDSYTQIALELLSGQLLIVLERQAASQVPEGNYMYFDPSDDLREN